MIGRTTFVSLAFLLVTLATATSMAEDEVEFSEAETRLWMTDQLGAISNAATLTYAFTRSGSLDGGFEDEVTFTVHDINEDGTKAASLEFFTGERNFPVPPVGSTNVNPVIKVYFQGDVYEMNRLTDPDGAARERWRYFQRRIKFALSQSAEVKAVEFTFNGRTWPGYAIEFTPYANDPRRNMFEQFADKHYSVIVSDKLPGYLYRIETVVPGDAESGEPLVREVLELSRIEEQG